MTTGVGSLRRALLAPFTTLSMGAAAIHFAVASSHFQTWWAFGVFIVGVAWFQALWPIAYVLLPSVRLALTGAFVNLAVALVWAWTRATGLPFGPASGSPMPVGLADIVATTFEVLLFAGLVLFSVRPIGRELSRRRLRGSASVVASSLVIAVVAITTTAAITLGA